MSPTYVFLFVAAAIVGLFGILANAVIIYSVFHFENLKTVSNTFLINWSIADFLSILSVPIFTSIYAMVYPNDHHAYSCLSINATIIFHVTVLWCAILLSIEWIAASYCVKLSEKLRRWYRYLLALIWITAILCYCLSATLCITDVYYYFSAVLFFISYTVCQLFTLALAFYRIINRFRTNQTAHLIVNSVQRRLTVVSIIPCSYLIVVIFAALAYFSVFNSIYNDLIIWSCVFIPVVPVLFRSVIVLGMLCYLDTDFRSCLYPKIMGIFKRNISKINVPHNKTYCVIPAADKALIE